MELFIQYHTINILSIHKHRKTTSPEPGSGEVLFGYYSNMALILRIPAELASSFCILKWPKTPVFST